MKIAAVQQTKLQKEKEEMISAMKTAMPEKEAVASDNSTSASVMGSSIGSVYKGDSEFGSSAGSESGLGHGASSEIGRTGKHGQLVNLCCHRNKKNIFLIFQSGFQFFLEIMNVGSNILIK